ELVCIHAWMRGKQLADQVVIVTQGRLAFQGTLAGVAAGCTAVAVAVRTPEAGRLIGALARAGAQAERTGPDGLRVTGVLAAEVSRVARAEGIDLHELAPSRASLEQEFLALTAGQGESPAVPASRGGQVS